MREPRKGEGLAQKMSHNLGTVAGGGGAPSLVVSDYVQCTLNWTTFFIPGSQSEWRDHPSGSKRSETIDLTSRQIRRSPILTSCYWMIYSKVLGVDTTMLLLVSGNWPLIWTLACRADRPGVINTKIGSGPSGHNWPPKPDTPSWGKYLLWVEPEVVVADLGGHWSNRCANNL